MNASRVGVVRPCRRLPRRRCRRAGPGARAAAATRSPPRRLSSTDAGDGRSAGPSASTGNGGRQAAELPRRRATAVASPGIVVGAISNETGRTRAACSSTVVSTTQSGQQQPGRVDDLVAQAVPQFVQFGGPAGASRSAAPAQPPRAAAPRPATGRVVQYRDRLGAGAAGRRHPAVSPARAQRRGDRSTCRSCPPVGYYGPPAPAARRPSQSATSCRRRFDSAPGDPSGAATQSPSGPAAPRRRELPASRSAGDRQASNL